jgi:hypothetical protein
LDTIDRTYVAEDVKVGEEVAEVFTGLGNTFGFQLPRPNKCHISPDAPWVNGQEILIKHHVQSPEEQRHAADVRCSQPPLWGQTKQMYYYYVSMPVLYSPNTPSLSVKRPVERR